MPEQILIDLHHSSNAREITGHLIHQAEINLVNSWIDADLKRPTVTDNERLHETITVLGTRGSGKTTFLLSLLKRLREDPDKNLCVLDIIDPTLIEEKGHIFLDIIARIKEKVDDELDKSDTNPESTAYLLKKDWNDHVKRLAHGLPLLDGVGGEMTEHNWQDAEYIMHNGLTAVNSARDLEHNFHLLIEKALGILKKDAFLIAFDDIDIDFRKGWRVLETIRKYFTTPKIIALMSGDIELYIKAIRKQQWKNFGKALLINEGQHLKKMASYNNMVNEMEGQYLQKVMKLNRRVNLTSLHEKLDQYQGTFEILITSANRKQYPIEGFYDSILFGYGIFSNLQAESFRNFLLGAPLRTQIQFLAAADPYQERLIGENVHITDAFLNNLLDKNVNLDLVYANPKFLNIVILEFLLNHRILDEAYQLQPTLRDPGLNAVLIAFSFLSAEKMRKDPYLIFDYLIKIGYVRNLESAFFATEVRDKKSTNPSTKGLCEHAFVFQDKVLRDIVGLMNAYIRASLNIGRVSDLPWGGTIILYALESRVKRGQENLVTRIDRVFAERPNRNLAYIPLSISESTTKQSSMAVYSFYSLLATVGELVRKNTDKEKGLYEYSQIRTYPMPEFITGLNSRGELENFEDDGGEGQYGGESLQLLDHLMTEWLEGYRGITVPPHLLGKISTRFFYALLNIDRSAARENLGDMFSLRVAAYLNAVLIEDTKENPFKFYRRVNLNNINTSYRIFSDNLVAVRENQPGRNDLRFSRWMLSCPLFLIYLNPEIVEQILAFSGKKHLPQILDLSVFRGLREVSVKGMNIPEEPSDPANFNAIANRLQAEGIPFSYFTINGKGTSQTKNTYIKKNLSAYFGTGPVSTHTLTEFRNYLKVNNIKW